MSELCPTCKRPLLPDAKTTPGPAFVKCDTCPGRASFIIHGKAMCFACWKAKGKPAGG